MSTKEGVLKLLSDNKGSDISGQTLACELGVSRNAVWKAICMLRRDGYEISSATNRGYRLENVTEKLSREEISYAASGIRELDIVVLDEIDSTNNEAKRRLAGGMTSRLLIAADAQTAGRGRLGRSFYSPHSSGLYMSVAFHSDDDFCDAVTITSAAAVAVAEVLDSYCNISSEIKWVNDIYIGNKKVCGILTEAMTGFDAGSGHSIIVGIGINCTTIDFPAEICERAGSVGHINRNLLCAAVAARLLELSENLKARSWISEYKKRSNVIGKSIIYTENGISHSAVAVDIDDNGGLIINENGAKKTLSTGEISVRTV